MKSGMVIFPALIATFLIFLLGCIGEKSPKEKEMIRDRAVNLLETIHTKIDVREYGEARKLVHVMYDGYDYRSLTKEEQGELWGENVFLLTLESFECITERCGNNDEFYLGQIATLVYRGAHRARSRFSEELITELKSRGAWWHLRQAEQSAEDLKFEDMRKNLKNAQKFEERFKPIKGFNLQKETARIATIFENRFQRIKKGEL